MCVCVCKADDVYILQLWLGLILHYVAMCIQFYLSMVGIMAWLFIHNYYRHITRICEYTAGSLEAKKEKHTKRRISGILPISIVDEEVFYNASLAIS